jgi:hypothetical protein
VRQLAHVPIVLNPQPRLARSPSSDRATAGYFARFDQVTPFLRAQAANILRLLILAPAGLLLVLVGLMLLTGRVEIGGPIIGGVMLIGFGAAQFGR